MHAHFAVGLSIDREGGRHLHIGVVEVGEFLLPVGFLELEEQGPQDALFVQRLVRKVFNLGWCELLTGSGLAEGFAALRAFRWASRWASSSARAARAAGSAGPTTTDASGGLFSDEEFPGRRAFLSIEALVAILVEAGHQ